MTKSHQKPTTIRPLSACGMIVPAVEFDSIQGPGTNVMIFEIFSPKNSAKKSSGFAQNTASFCKNFDHNIVFF
jgi:hypothetical protein